MSTQHDLGHEDELEEYVAALGGPDGVACWYERVIRMTLKALSAGGTINEKRFCEFLNSAGREIQLKRHAREAGLDVVEDSGPGNGQLN